MIKLPFGERARDWIWIAAVLFVLALTAISTVMGLWYWLGDPARGYTP